MAEKSYKQFDGKVCEKIRNLLAAKKRAVAKRDNLFAQRDDIKGQIDACTGGEKEKKNRLLAEYGETVIEIDRYRRAITRFDGELDECVEAADANDERLFSEVSVDVSEYLQGQVRVDPRNAGKPVGGPSASEPPKRLRLAQPEPPTGVDEHLKASVAELDMRDDLKTACVNAGRGHINGLVVIIDGPDELASMQTTLNVTEKDAKAIIRAVKAYRSAHRGAMRQAEQTA